MPVPTVITDLSATPGSNSPAGTDNVFPDLDNYLRAHAGFIRQVYDAKLRDLVSLKDYGAVGNGVANDTSAVQAAVDAVSAAGGGVLWVPPGTYLVDTITMAANVRLEGQGVSSIFKLRTGTLLYMFLVQNVSNVGFVNLAFDNNLGTSTDGIGSVSIFHRGVSSAANNMLVENCTFSGGLTRPYVDSQSSLASRGIRILNSKFIGKSTLTILPIVNPLAPPAQTSGAIRFLCVTGCGEWEIRGNTSTYCGRFLQIRHPTTQAVDLFDSMVVADNIVANILDDPNLSTSPYEIFCVTGLTVTGNTIRSGGRGFNATYVKSATYSGNTAYDQTKYFLELQSSDGVTFSGNTAYNCKTFINDTTSVGSSNIHIVGNSVIGGSTGETGYDANTFTNVITMQPSGTYANWRIADNIFSGQQYVDATIRIDGTTSNIEVVDNQFLQTEATQRPRAVMVNAGSNIRVRGNTIVRSVDISNSTLTTNSVYSFIELTTGSGGSDIRVENNKIKFTGADTRTGGNNTGVIGIGGNLSAAALAGVVVEGNVLSGTFANPLRLQITSGDTVVSRNNLTGATGSVSYNSAVTFPEINVKNDFGAKGDGVTDDTVAIQAAVDYVAANGGTLHLPTGTYNVTARITRLTSAKPFCISGDGKSTIIKRASAFGASVMEFRQSDDVVVRDFVIDGQHSVNGAGNHGLVIYDSERPRVINVHAQDYTNSGILVYSLATARGGARIDNCSVDGNGRSPVGILISSMYDSGMHRCSATGCTTVGTGSDGYGLELKNECDGCFITDSYASDCTVAVAFGQDIVSTAVKNSRVSVISKSCDFGFVCGRAESNHVDIVADMNGAVSGEQIIDLQTDSKFNTVRVTARNVVDSKRVVRIRTSCTDNYVNVNIVGTLPAASVVALFDAGSERNTVQLERLGTTPMPSTGFDGLVVDSSTANSNTFRYSLYPRVESRTIATGAITVKDPSSEVIILDTEAAAASDDLDTINGPTFEGKLIVLHTLANARDVVVKHNTGNIRLNGLADFTLDGTADTLSLRWNAGINRWCEVARSNNV